MPRTAPKAKKKAPRKRAPKKRPKAANSDSAEITKGDSESPEDPKSVGRLLTSPAFSAAATFRIFHPDLSENLLEIRDALKWHAKQIEAGDQSQPIEMLSAQAFTLDGVFNWALLNATTQGGSLQRFELYSKIALKAQAQSVRSLEAIASITQGSGKSVLIAGQANIAGQQVINNVSAGAQGCESDEEPCIVRSAKNGNSPKRSNAALDERSTQETLPGNPPVEAVGAVHRTKNGRG